MIMDATAYSLEMFKFPVPHNQIDNIHGWLANIFQQLCQHLMGLVFNVSNYLTNFNIQIKISFIDQIWDRGFMVGCVNLIADLI